MTRDEFELRFTAYRGMKTRFKLDWDIPTLVQLTQRNDQGKLEKPLHETSVADLHLLTKETYLPFKNQFIAQHQEIKV